MPARIMMGTDQTRTRSYLLSKTELFTRAQAAGWVGPDAPGTRRLFGWRLPSIQRPAVWTPAQQTRFIESAWLGFHLGVIVVTGPDEDNHPNADLLIDGQQRLGAFQAYWNGAVPAFGAYWADVRRAQQQRFLDDPLLFTTLDPHLPEALLTELYVRLNFGGTPHQPEDHPDAQHRAT